MIKIHFYEEDFRIIVHKIKWLNNEEIMITNLSSEINFKFSVIIKTLELIFTPAFHDLQYLTDELMLLNPETSKEDYSNILKKRLAS
jgi:hypothetical protein